MVIASRFTFENTPSYLDLNGQSICSRYCSILFLWVVWANAQSLENIEGDFLMRKNRHITKILSILLCVILLCTFGASAVFAEDGTNSKSFTVRFLVGETELAEYTQVVEEGLAIPTIPPAPEGEGREVFDGWQDNTALDSQPIQDFSGYIVEKDVSFSAVFSSVSEDGPKEPAKEDPTKEDPTGAPSTDDPITNYHVVTFVPNNDTAENFTQIVEDGKLSNQPAPPVPNLQNRQTAFIGWFLPDADQPFDFANTPITEDITLNAHYIENYLIKYKSAPGGEELVVDSVELSPSDIVPQTNVVIAPPENSFLEYLVCRRRKR